MVSNGGFAALFVKEGKMNMRRRFDKTFIARLLG